MARGKHANRAEANRARQDDAARIADLERRNRNLQTDLERAQQDLNNTLGTLNAEAQRLRLMVISGTSDALVARDERIRELLSERAEMSGYVEGVRAHQVKISDALIDHFVNDHGETVDDAINSLVGLAGGRGFILDNLLADKVRGGRLTSEAARRIATARGLISPTSEPRGTDNGLRLVAAESLAALAANDGSVS